MVFVDGENLAIRYRKSLGDAVPESHVVELADVFVWSKFLVSIPSTHVEVIRTHYYTSVGQDEVKRREVEEQLKSLGIQAPRVFSKIKGSRSKRVDISLATDMLSHAHRDNYDLAILVAGDQDYLPLVHAVAAEGKRVVVWFLPNGISDALRLAADHYYDLSQLLFQPGGELMSYHM